MEADEKPAIVIMAFVFICVGTSFPQLAEGDPPVVLELGSANIRSLNKPQVDFWAYHCG